MNQIRSREVKVEYLPSAVVTAARTEDIQSESFILED